MTDQSGALRSKSLTVQVSTVQVWEDEPEGAVIRGHPGDQCDSESQCRGSRANNIKKREQGLGPALFFCPCPARISASAIHLPHDLTAMARVANTQAAREPPREQVMTFWRCDHVKF
jgi:hypothetical protein